MKHILSAATAMVLAAALCVSAVAVVDPADWKLGRDQGGIQAFLRNYPGADMKEFKGVMRVRGVRLSSLVATFDDTPSYTRWMHNCTESRLVKVINERERITYTVTSAPWPATDRDTVVYSLISQDPKTLAVTIAITNRPDFIPKQKGRVRLPMMKALWTFMPLDSGEVMITYQTVNRAGGGVPQFLLNLSAIDLPFYTMDKFRKVASEAKYSNAVYDFIEEPVTTVMGAEAKAEG
ncbi:MAG TPA: START domain-containing protein [Spirochaetota bacterium]|nr:START domain-containing protein [Spirochaetota bacterium]HOD16295.1 START domain-containing protein [Spirochaetota bacterium]HPN10812.1 START domain-containing protein [Spirochaetota bacterium]HQL82435.1 START domain-containing protein [Spirochaetota bacterium]